MTPTLGRIVHYRLPDLSDYFAGAVVRWRPAIVVNVHDHEPVGQGARLNLTVFLDGLDEAIDKNDPLWEDDGFGGVFLSVKCAAEGTDPGNWRWPPRHEAGQRNPITADLECVCEVCQAEEGTLMHQLACPEGPSGPTAIEAKVAKRFPADTGPSGPPSEEGLL